MRFPVLCKVVMNLPERYQATTSYLDHFSGEASDRTRISGTQFWKHDHGKKVWAAGVLLIALGAPRTGSEFPESLEQSGSCFTSQASVSSLTTLSFAHRYTRGKYWWIFLEKLSWASEHVVLPLFPHTLPSQSCHNIRCPNPLRSGQCSASCYVRYVHSTNIVCGTQVTINMSVELLKQWYLSPDSWLGLQEQCALRQGLINICCFVHEQQCSCFRVQGWSQFCWLIDSREAEWDMDWMCTWRCLSCGCVAGTVSDAQGQMTASTKGKRLWFSSWSWQLGLKARATGQPGAGAYSAQPLLIGIYRAINTVWGCNYSYPTRVEARGQPQWWCPLTQGPSLTWSLSIKI